MKYKSICIIPARYGSKRVPRKNIINFFGKPLIGHVIQNAIKSNCFQKIYVSTDSIKIKKISEKFGAVVPYIRSKKLSNDKAVVNDVIRDFLKKVNINKNIKLITVIYPTAIFVNKKLISKSISKISKNVNFVSTVKKFPHPIQRAFVLKNKKIRPISKTNFKKRTQDFKDTFFDAGQIYVFKIKNFFNNENSFNSNTVLIELNALESVDIDNFSDFKNAKKLFKLNKFS